MVLQEDLSLDMDDIEAQAQIESLMPAELVECEYRDIPLTQENGEVQIRKAWVLVWDRLDRDMTGASGQKFTYQSTHWLPDGSRPVTSRREMQYAKQVACFSALGLKGKSPPDFLGVKHWVRETTERRSTRPWWRSEAIYTEGQSYEEAIGKEVINLNPPVAVVTDTDVNTEEVTLDEDSPYTLLLETINGMTHRQAITVVKQTEGLSDNSEIVNGLQSGSLIDQMIEHNLLKEEDGKYYRVTE
tara:strand:- start:2580 stop:3311 length:732 start_codon:yes stop_codon:yes gene_type:complete